MKNFKFKNVHFFDIKYIKYFRNKLKKRIFIIKFNLIIENQLNIN